MFFRVTYDGQQGIYEAFKQKITLWDWRTLLKSEKLTWLPKPPSYTKGFKSYFTEKGYQKFKSLTFPIFEKELDKKKIKVKQFDSLSNIIYQDEFQVVTDERYLNIESKFDQLYKKIMIENQSTSSEIKHLYLDRYKILTEIVTNKQLTPVPQKLIKDICNHFQKVQG